MVPPAKTVETATAFLEERYDLMQIVERFDAITRVI
jgi:hypothetical protein